MSSQKNFYLAIIALAVVSVPIYAIYTEYDGSVRVHGLGGVGIEIERNR